MEVIDKVGLLSFKNKNILMAKSKGRDKFYLPGGKREAEETDQACLTREIKEELGVELIPQTVKYYGTFEDQAHGKPEGVMIKLICYTGDFTGEARPESEIASLEYLPFSRKPDTGTVAHKIFDDLKSKGLLD
ncbi:MAG TPA: NUDIX domain-containing protein [Methylomirabilota bacterium]|nr:NUDIX domain-containing protein [Methylomirabilota bacterium]